MKVSYIGAAMLLLLLMQCRDCSGPSSAESAIRPLDSIKEQLDYTTLENQATIDVIKDSTGTYQSYSLQLENTIVEKETLNNLPYKLEQLSQVDLQELVLFEGSHLVVDQSFIPGPTPMAKLPIQGTPIHYCGTRDRAPATATKAFKPNRLLTARYLNTRTFSIPVVFHLIKQNDNDYPDTRNRLSNQIEVLNAAFVELNVIFRIEAINEKVLPQYANAWFDPDNQVVFDAAVDMSIELQVTSDQVINVYVNTPGILGQASFPWEDNYLTSTDNVIIHHETLPGAKLGGIPMEGKTLVHEIGHFLGLYHTFHDPSAGNLLCSQYNSCNTIGDRIADTPPQRYCLQGSGQCDTRTGDDCVAYGNNPCGGSTIPCDTCPGDGVDPVDNYMGYNYDEVMKRFTDQQINRMSTFLFGGDRRYLIISPPTYVDFPSSVPQD